jgi:hypothetical protein
MNKTPTEAEISAAWAAAIDAQNRLTAAQAKVPAATAAEADLSAEDAMWRRALAAVQGGGT